MFSGNHGAVQDCWFPSASWPGVRHDHGWAFAARRVRAGENIQHRSLACSRNARSPSRYVAPRIDKSQRFLESPSSRRHWRPDTFCYGLDGDEFIGSSFHLLKRDHAREPRQNQIAQQCRTRPIQENGDDDVGDREVCSTRPRRKVADACVPDRNQPVSRRRSPAMPIADRDADPT